MVHKFCGCAGVEKYYLPRCEWAKIILWITTGGQGQYPADRKVQYTCMCIIAHYIIFMFTYFNTFEELSYHVCIRDVVQLKLNSTRLYYSHYELCHYIQ